MYIVVYMQTFLPYRSFNKSVSALDDRRLWKQILEANHIMDVLIGVSDSWKHHPAVAMWRGHERLLFWYIVHCQRERSKRKGIDENVDLNYEAPFDDPLYISHRVNLYRKNPKHYKKFYFDGIETCPDKYFWVVPTGDGSRKSSQDWLEWYSSTLRGPCQWPNGEQKCQNDPNDQGIYTEYAHGWKEKRR